MNGYGLEQEAAIKASTGLAAGDDRSFFWRLSGRENLEFFAALHGLERAAQKERVQEVLAQIDLLPMAERPFAVFSTGMRQRLAIARALLNQPHLLFLDEPSRGLDPNAAESLHHLIQQELVHRQGITVFLTTHDLEEAEKLCDRIAILHHGRIRACDTPENLRKELHLTPTYHIHTRGLQAQEIGSLDLPAVQISPAPAGHGDDLQVMLTEDATGELLNRVIHKITACNAAIVEVSRHQTSLDEVFKRYTRQTGIDPSLAPDRPFSTPAWESQSESEEGPPGALAHKPVLLSRIAAAFLRRDWRSETSYRFAFALQFAGLFISALAFFFIAQMFGESATQYLSSYGGDYFSFVLIGIAFAGYFGVGLTSFTSSLRSAQTTGTLEAMLATPARLSTLILSASIWDYLLTTFKVLVHLLVGVLLGVNLAQANLPAALAALSMSILAFAGLGILAACFIIVFKRGDPIAWAMSALAGLFGGVYYPVEVLPDWLETLSRFLPVTYALQAVRKALLLGAGLEDIFPELAALAGFACILLPLSLWLFRLAVRRARDEGTLTHY